MNSTEILKISLNSKFENSNIYLLSELKPAGVKLILEPNVGLIEILKVTLFDLALKQVLVVKKEYKKLHPREPFLREYTIVETGKNFAKYNPNEFEKYFTDRIDENSYFQLKSYLRAIFKDITSTYNFKKEIIRDLKINNLFDINFISNIFSWLKTNSEGNIIKKDIKEYLKNVDEKIGELIENEPDKALELIIFLQGNIFLLKNLKFEFLEKIKATTTAESNLNQEFYNDLFWYEFMNDSDLSISELFNDMSEMFDSANDYFESYSGDGSYDTDYTTFID
jgi:hypothetical protein